MKIDLAVEKRGANVEFRAQVISEVTHKVDGRDQNKVDVIAIPAVFQAHPVEMHARPAPLLRIPLDDAMRLAKQILQMKE